VKAVHLKRVDPSLPLVLYCDWSEKGIGAVLAQIDAGGVEHLCACSSRSLNKHEKNYCSFKGELLACVWACQVFRQYLHGRHFTIITDHQPLLWLVQKKDLTGQYGRWAMILSDYHFTILHRKGSTHTNADALSRLPRQSSEDVSGARLDEEHVSSVAAVLCGASGLPFDTVGEAFSFTTPSIECSAMAAISSMLACNPLGPCCVVDCEPDLEGRALVDSHAQASVQLALASRLTCMVSQYAQSLSPVSGALDGLAPDTCDLQYGMLCGDALPIATLSQGMNAWLHCASVQSNGVMLPLQCFQYVR